MSLQAAYDQARLWLESNDLDRAIGLAQHILSQYPDNLEAYRILGEAYLANRQLDRAQESFERVLRSDPENIPAHVGLGITSERQGQLARAITEFEQALEIKPDMTELRSQLLRLYAEGWGSEHAQLRLSRAGLARLYAKGHMLPQAIAEFRQVVADQPSRFDAMVALAETLWRDGQEEEAIALCRDILAVRPESLKANLLLGYLLLSSGNPDGERHWAAATRMDPYQSVARALFETLPQQPTEEPVIEEWDEAAWRSRRAAEEQEQVPATRPMEAITPIGTPAAAGALGGVGALGAAALAQPPPPSPAPAAAPEADDFLASLLAIDNPPPPPPSPLADVSDEALGLDAEMAPFSLDDLEREIHAPEQPTADLVDEVAESPEPAGLAEEEPALTPFSLADLGLSDEEIAGIESLNEAAAAAPAAEEEPALTPFSLADLGLSDEEIAGIESLNEAAAPVPQLPELSSPPPQPEASAAPDAGDDLPDMSDLPLDLQPFSIDELDLGADAETTGDAGLPSALQPFSLDEPPQRPRVSGFTAPENLDENESVSDEDDFAPDSRGFSWQQATQRPETGFVKSTQDEPPSGEVSIFSKLKQQHMGVEKRSPEPPPASIERDEHLGLFSLDDVPLHDEAGTPEPSPAEPSGHAGLGALGAAGLGALAGMAAAHKTPDEGGPSEEPAGPDVEATVEPPQLAAPDLGAAAGVIDASAPSAEPAPEIESLEDALASGQVQPFSLADLGLSDEEIAAIEGTTPAGAAPEAPVQEPPGAQTPEIESLEDALASGQVQPFSLADLGLSDEEIAAMGLSDAAGVADTSLDAPGAPREDLVSDAGADEPTARVEPADESALLVPDIKPFSLADLGLSDEEISALGLESSMEQDEGEDVGLGLTEEELEGLDGGDLQWLQSTPPAPPPLATPEAGALGPQTTSGDLVVDRLIALGRQQGYVDIADIIANVEDPEAEADRIEEIGQRLHEARVEIRDGDEVVDMDAEDEEIEFAGELEDLAPETPPDIYATRELDLASEDVDLSGAAEVAPAADELRPLEEPDMTPFSLSELGLTEDEINALGLSAPSAPAPSQEPDMTPFSLSELGLSDEEIAALGLDEPALSGVPPEPIDEAPAELPGLIDLGEIGSDAAALVDEQLAAEDTISPPAAYEETPTEPPAAETPPAAPPSAPVPAPAAAAEARPPSDGEAVSTGHDVLDAFVRQLEADPQNEVLRLSVARVGGQLGLADLAVKHYKYLIKNSRLLDDVVEELQDLIAYNDDRKMLQRLHRTLGDAYSKQGRLRDAIDEYSWR